MLENQDGLPAEISATLGPQLRRALGHPTRRRILRALRESRGPLTLDELSEALPEAGIPTLRYHLLILTEAGCARRAAEISRRSGLIPAYGPALTGNLAIFEALRDTRRVDEAA